MFKRLLLSSVILLSSSVILMSSSVNAQEYKIPNVFTAGMNRGEIQRIIGHQLTEKDGLFHTKEMVYATNFNGWCVFKLVENGLVGYSCVIISNDLNGIRNVGARWIQQSSALYGPIVSTKTVNPNADCTNGGIDVIFSTLSDKVQVSRCDDKNGNLGLMFTVQFKMEKLMEMGI